MVPVDLAHPIEGEQTVAFDEETLRAHAGRAVCGDPVIEELRELRVQRDVGIVVERSDRDPAQPGRGVLSFGTVFAA
jgi:hypothetical protein